jgi:AmiR/NasT family two-component response regulator
MADVATIGILQERGSQRREVLAHQLQDALSSRIVIEQAKGVIAERQGVHVDSAFEQLRTWARSHGEPLSEVARRIVANELRLHPTDPATARDAAGARRPDPPRG